MIIWGAILFFWVAAGWRGCPTGLFVVWSVDYAAGAPPDDTIYGVRSGVCDYVLSRGIRQCLKIRGFSAASPSGEYGTRCVCMIIYGLSEYMLQKMV